MTKSITRRVGVGAFLAVLATTIAAQRDAGEALATFVVCTAAVALVVGVTILTHRSR